MDCIDTTHTMVTLIAANSPVRCVIFHPTCHILSQMFEQSNLDLSGLFSQVSIFSRILISCDLENSNSQKAQ